MQSIGLIFIKKTRDPLDGVSKLDFVYLVSVTQKQNIAYMNAFQKTEEWDQLDSLQQEQFFGAW